MNPISGTKQSVQGLKGVSLSHWESGKKDFQGKCHLVTETNVSEIPVLACNRTSYLKHVQN